MTATASSDIFLGPYVNNVTPTRAKVLWVPRPGAAADLSPRLDVEPLDPDVAAPPTVSMSGRAITGREERLRIATVSDLVPGQRYAYTLTGGRARVEGGFQAALPKGDRTPFRFAVYADTRGLPERHVAVAQAVAKELPFAFMLNSGDFCSDGTVLALWKEQFFDPACPVLPWATIWPARGNHEEDAVLYRDLFDLPGNGLYYSFDFGNMHVVVLDPNRKDEGETDTEMLAWLEQDLAAADADWIIACYHQPTFDAGGYGSTWGQEDFLPVMEKHSVDIVINGHSHIYERFRPIGPEGGKPIIHVVSAGGGAPTYEIRPSPMLEASYAGIHYCIVDVDGERLSMVVRTPDGKLLDTLRLVKTNGMFQKEIMDRAVPTQDAIALTFCLAGLNIDLDTVPEPGGPLTVSIDPGRFPPGGTVSMETATDGAWQVEPATFRIGAEPLRLRVVAPADLKVTPSRFEPGLTVDVTVEYNGRTYAQRNVPASPTRDAIRLLTPEPPAARVYPAPGPITVDGDAADWRGVPPLVLSGTGKESRFARLAWAHEGLYGFLAVPADGIEVKLSSVSLADGLEVFVEGDFARSFNARKNPLATKCDMAPLPDDGPGRAHVHVSYGLYKKDPEKVKAAWQPTETGYNLEFFIPSATMARDGLAAGRKMGFQFILRDGGELVEQFSDTTGKPGAWYIPLYWGAIELVR